MANPQKKKGFTPIRNEIMEALARIRIPGEARQVLDVIIRKTCGFHKKEDRISLSQFHLVTGIKKPSIIRAIKLLRSMNLIYKKAKGSIASYKFNTDISSWKPLAKKLTVSKKVNEPLRKSKSSFTKKLPTKETITKEKIHHVFEKWNSLKIVVHKKKDDFEQHINARLQDGYKAKEIIEAMENFAKIYKDDRYWWNQQWDLKDFLTRKNGIDRFLSKNDPFNRHLKPENKNEEVKGRTGHDEKKDYRKGSEKYTKRRGS